MNQPWGLSGPQFLAVYAAAFVLALLLGSQLRSVLRRRPAQRDDEPLDLYILAALAGGADRVVETAAHGLLADDALRVSRDHRLAATGAAGADPVQQWVLDSCRPVTTMTLNRLRVLGRGAQPVAAVQAEAVRRGLLLAPGRRRALRLAALLPLAVFGAGIARLVNGVHLGRPVGLLVLLLVVSVPVLLVFTAKVPRTTLTGRKVLAEQARAWRSKGVAAVPLPRTGTTPADAGLLLPGALTGIALAGAVGVTDPTLRYSLYGSSATSSSGGGSSDSGGSSGGCGGAGGCGGGGCGGGCGG